MVDNRAMASHGCSLQDGDDVHGLTVRRRGERMEDG